MAKKFFLCLATVMMLTLVALQGKALAAPEKPSLNRERTIHVSEAQCTDPSIVVVETPEFSGPFDGLCFKSDSPNAIAVLKIRGAYGVTNKTNYPLRVTATNEYEAVFWQADVAPKSSRNVQVGTSTMTIVEIQFGDASKLNIPSSSFIPGNTISLKHPTENLYLTKRINGMKGLNLTLGSDFPIRVDASFEVQSALDGKQGCISLSSISQRDWFLTLSADGKLRVEPVPTDRASLASWCPTSQKGLQLSSDPNKHLFMNTAFLRRGEISLSNSPTNWDVKNSLAFNPQ